MLRRNIASLGLAGNGIIGIRREDKNVWERRVPLNPSQVSELLKRGTVKKVVVQPSTIRCFDDRAYEEAGAEINEDLSEANTIVAVKEVPAQLLMPERTYMFFSHTIKAQPYNMPLLDTILQKKIRLLDYERITNDEGRMVKFGPYAGFAGTIDTLHALGLALLTRGFATPFLHLSLSKEYSSLDVARADLREIGEQIRTRGLPKELGPLTVAITGSGSVSNACQQILHLLPCKYVLVEDLPKIWASENFERNVVHVVIVRSQDMAVPKDPSKRFSKSEYYKNPQDYEPIYHETVAPYVHVLINGMYWEPRFPRLLTTAQAKELKEENRFPLLCLGDITCDIGGSVEFFVKATTIQNPLYVYDIDTDAVVEMHQFNGQGVIILGVDHLPAEFPREASTDFGRGLLPLVEEVAVSDGTQDLQSQEKSLGPYCYKAMVTNQGGLTPHFNYISKMRAKNEAAAEQDRVLVIGAGMMSGPCVQYLLNNPKNIVTVVDGNQANLDHLTSQFGKGVPGRSETSGLRTVKANVATIDEYLESMIKASDCVVSLLPAFMHHIVGECAVKHSVPMVTASYVSPQMAEIGKKAEANNTVIVSEMGLDPGIDIMTSAELLHSIRQQGGVIKSYVSLCGALPQPENTDCPMGYKFSWSPRGVLTAATRPTKFLAGGQWFDVDGKYLYHLIQDIGTFKGMNLKWIPNGDSSRYVNHYDLQEADTLIRGTFRYDGFAPVVLAFVELGLLNETNVMPALSDTSKETITWRQLLTTLLGGSDANIVDTVFTMAKSKIGAVRSEVLELEAFKALCALKMSREASTVPAKSLDLQMQDVTNAFHRLGLFSDTPVPKTTSGLVIDSLCTHLIKKMSYHSHERDFNLMMHRIVAHFPSKNKTRVFKSTLALRGHDIHHSATARTVGIPVAISAQHILDGGLAAKKGIVIPTDIDLYRPVLQKLELEGIKMVEEVYDI